MKGSQLMKGFLGIAVVPAANDDTGVNNINQPSSSHLGGKRYLKAILPTKLPSIKHVFAGRPDRHQEV